MSNKIVKLSVAGIVFAALLPVSVIAEDEMAVDIVADERPVFQQIADLEQEKVLLQLEKEKAQLMLDLDRMAAEQARLRSDMEKMAGTGDEEAQKLEIEREKLEQEREKLVAQKEKLEEQMTVGKAQKPAAESADGDVAGVSEEAAVEEVKDTAVAKRYRLIEIIGAGRQLQATLEDLGTGQKKKVWAGKDIDGYQVQSVSLDDGVVFTKDGVSESLNMGIVEKE